MTASKEVATAGGCRCCLGTLVRAGRPTHESSADACRADSAARRAGSRVGIFVRKVIYYTRCTTGAANNKGGQKGEGADMARKWSIWRAAALVAVLAGLGVIGVSAAPPATADATAVMQWNIIAISTIVGIPGPGLPGPAGGAPPASQINMGMVQGAVYDAVNAITPKHFRPYLLKRRFGNTASDEAAVATAAYLVLKNIVETVPQSITFPNRATLLASLASGTKRRRTRYPTRRSRTWESLPGPRRRKP